MAPGPATHSTRWRRRPKHGTWWRSDTWPGWLSRTRRLGRDRAGLPSEPGCGFCQNFPLPAELPVVASEPMKLLTTSAAQTILTAAFVSIGLAHSIPDRLGGGLELPRQLLRRAASTDQINHLLPEFRRVRRACLQHFGLLSSQFFRCPRKRGKSIPHTANLFQGNCFRLAVHWHYLVWPHVQDQ